MPSFFDFFISDIKNHHKPLYFGCISQQCIFAVLPQWTTSFKAPHLQDIKLFYHLDDTMLIGFSKARSRSYYRLIGKTATCYGVGRYSDKNLGFFHLLMFLGSQWYGVCGNIPSEDRKKCCYICQLLQSKRAQHFLSLEFWKGHIPHSGALLWPIYQLIQKATAFYSNTEGKKDLKCVQSASQNHSWGDMNRQKWFLQLSVSFWRWSKTLPSSADNNFLFQTQFIAYKWALVVPELSLGYQMSWAADDEHA